MTEAEKRLWYRIRDCQLSEHQFDNTEGVLQTIVRALRTPKIQL
jgi:hypothetical protein